MAQRVVVVLVEEQGWVQEQVAEEVVVAREVQEMVPKVRGRRREKRAEERRWQRVQDQQEQRVQVQALAQ